MNSKEERRREMMENKRPNGGRSKKTRCEFGQRKKTKYITFFTQHGLYFLFISLLPFFSFLDVYAYNTIPGQQPVLPLETSSPTCQQNTRLERPIESFI